MEEPIIPTAKVVNKKYRRGTLVGKIARHLGDHKNVRKIFAGNLAAMVIATSFLPSVKAKEFSQTDEPVIETQNPINTQKGTQFPLENVKINQGFSLFHPALDLGAEIGTPIKPIKAGVIVAAGFENDGYGNTIVIDHGQGLSSRYAHLSKIEVQTGQSVTTNDEIGKVGITGHSTGPHLHLEIRQNGFPLNPLNVLPR